MSEDKIPSKEIGELLDEVSTKIPKLVTGIMDSLYSPEAGANMGKAIGALYSELLKSGIPQEDALKMARDYMISMKQVMDSFKDSTK